MNNLSDIQSSQTKKWNHEEQHTQFERDKIRDAGPGAWKQPRLGRPKDE